MATKISIPGLTDSQKEALAGVKVGDFIRLIKTHAYRPGLTEDDESGTDDISSGAEGASDDDENAEYADESANFAQGSINEPSSDEVELSVEHVEEREADETEEAAEESGEGEERDGEENEDSQRISESSDGETGDVFSVITLLFVHHLAYGLDNAIEEMDVIEMDYAPHPDQAGAPTHTYQLLGNAVSHSQTHTDQCQCEQTRSVAQIDEDYKLSSYTIELNPSGDSVRNEVALRLGAYHCPVNCDYGFLYDLGDLPRVLKSTVYTTPVTLPHSPLCPVCMGLDLLVEQQNLKLALENNSWVEIEKIVEHLGRVNPRRRALGYEVCQFDEREWGLLFDDMYEDDEGDDAYEWLNEEAMDPNYGYRVKPTKQEAIDALPRKAFANVECPEKQGEQCLICREEFAQDTMVVELPCSHVFHDAECIALWLSASHQCPTCRAKLPVAVDDGYAVAAQQMVEGGASGGAEGDGEQAAEDADEAMSVGQQELDVVLRDAIHASVALVDGTTSAEVLQSLRRSRSAAW
ncbi:hypothetical protein LTR53_013051 [Teratosphaeriaceae sp. CCFEE 6253]|nr:hypothetical protein LTR53_013051 [Teratosphaeriaceae sp. CCFEE 6253]